jgi:serine phosphatase RsbU (regulator of sigma subunit)
MKSRMGQDAWFPTRGLVGLSGSGGSIGNEAALAKKHGARSRWLRYGSAFISLAVATNATLLLDPILSRHPYYLWFVCALLFTAWYGGVGPATLNLLLGPVALAFFVLHPRFDIRVESLEDQSGLLLYSMTALAMLLYSKSGGIIRSIVKSSLEQTPLQEMPRLMAEIETQLAYYVAKSELVERRLTAQFRLARILTDTNCVEEAIRPILQVVCESLGWEVGLCWLVDRHAGKLQNIESWGRRTEKAEEFQRASKQFTFSKGEGFPGRVWAADSVVWVSDTAKDFDLPRWKLATKVGLHEAIGFPLRDRIEFLGVMEFIGREIGEPNEHLVETMASIGNQVTQFVERKHAEKLVREQNHDRRLARQIQEGLLPAVMPRVPGFQIAGRVFFATEVGGDYFDFMPMPVRCDDCIGIAIGDAAGHGLASALLIAETRAYLNALALTLNEPGKMLALANRRLTSKTNGDHFVTHLLVRLDPRKRVLTYAGAGHCPGYVLDHQGQTKAVLTSTGMPLGVDFASEFPASSEVALEPGDLIVLFTDGVVETQSAKGQLFGSERLLASIHQHRERSPDEILDALFQAVTDHAQGSDQSDDATAVILKVEATAE